MTSTLTKINSQAELTLMKNSTSFFQNITQSQVVGSKYINFKNPLCLEPFLIVSLGYLVSISKYVLQPGSTPPGYMSFSATNSVSTFFLFSCNFNEYDPYLPVGDIIVPVNLITNIIPPPTPNTGPSGTWTSYNTTWENLPVLLVKNDPAYCFKLSVDSTNFKQLSQFYYSRGANFLMGDPTVPACAILEYKNLNNNFLVLGNVSQYSFGTTIAGVNTQYLNVSSNLITLGIYYNTTVPPETGIAANFFSGIGYYSTPFFNFRFGFPIELSNANVSASNNYVSPYWAAGNFPETYISLISTNAKNNIFCDIYPLEWLANVCYSNSGGSNCTQTYQTYCQGTNLTTTLCQNICTTDFNCTSNLHTFCQPSSSAIPPFVANASLPYAGASNAGVINDYQGQSNSNTCPCYLNTSQYQQWYNQDKWYNSLPTDTKNAAIQQIMNSFQSNCDFGPCKNTTAIPVYNAPKCENNILTCITGIQNTTGSVADSNIVSAQVNNCSQNTTGGSKTPSDVNQNSTPSVNIQNSRSPKTAKIIAIVVIVIILIAIGVFMMKK